MNAQTTNAETTLSFSTCAEFNQKIREVTNFEELSRHFGISESTALKLAIEGACRVMSKDTAGKVSIASIGNVMAVWREGFKDAAEKAAYERSLKQAATPSKGSSNKINYGRFELLGALSDLIGKDKAKQASLEKVKAYDETTFATFIKVQGAKPESLVAQAIAILDKAAKDKEEAERERAAAEEAERMKGLEDL